MFSIVSIITFIWGQVLIEPFVLLVASPSRLPFVCLLLFNICLGLQQST